MDVSVIQAVSSGNYTWSNLDHITPQDLANLWASGKSVTASLCQSKAKGGAGKFQHANVIMVRIPLANLPLKVAMGADFTEQYATVAAYSAHELLLGFELPAAETNATSFLRLLAGLETVYAGSVGHGNAVQAYGLGSGGFNAVVLGNKLDSAGVNYLDKLGQEAKALAKGRGAYLRSRIHIDRSTLLTLPGGEKFTLQQLPIEAQVYCPVHVDADPTAVVHWYADGTPGVQCSHCRRTYPAPMTQRNYDFGYFDRTVNALAESAENRDVTVDGLVYSSDAVTYLSERYLPTLELMPGVTFIKSPKGTGKTQALANLLAQCKKEHQHVLLLGHRRALLQSISARLGLDCYFIADSGEVVHQVNKTGGTKLLEIDDDASSSVSTSHEFLADMPCNEDTRYKRVDPTAYYAICLDSMMELEPENGSRQYDFVIIDEAEQVFSHLTGETLKGRRREVYARLAYYLRVAKSVYLLDADLGMVTMATAFEVFKPETSARFIINKPKITQGEIKLYGNRGQLVQVLSDRVGAGEKIFVATNSKRKAIDLSKMIGERYPHTRIAVVTSDNAQQNSIQDLLGNITAKFEQEIDVLIASPAIGTGIDITFKDENGNPRKVVDSVFGLFEANIVTHFDIDQQLMRVRHPGEVHVWIDPVELNYETDAKCIKRELEKTVRKTGYLLRYEDDGSPVFADDGGLVSIWAEVQAAARGSKNKLTSLFCDLRSEGGWNPVSVEFDEVAAEMGKEEVVPLDWTDFERR